MLPIRTSFTIPEYWLRGEERKISSRPPPYPDGRLIKWYMLPGALWGFPGMYS